jgi:formylmethanofuran dehydrogenase subunit E
MNIGTYSFEEYMDRVQAFHGSIAPGMLAGGIMVTIAREHLPKGEIFDVICESGHCLPDAVQLLTPCTIGNGWLKIVNTSRYALILYNKYTGTGIRVYLDADKLSGFPGSGRSRSRTWARSSRSSRGRARPYSVCKRSR